MRFVFVLLIFICAAFAGCENPATQQPSDPVPGTDAVQKAPEKAGQLEEQEIKKIARPAPTSGRAPSSGAFQPFYVFSSKNSRKNHYIPSGFMPNGKCITFTDNWQENCHGGKTCIKVVYDVECSRDDQKWAGVYWLNPANNWGKRKGGFNLTGAQKLTFWARGNIGGEQVQEFTMGGITGDYPDSDTAVIGPVILGPQWRQYTIDLRGKDLSYISGGFAWTTSEEVNPEDCTFYLDDIRFE